MQHAEKAAAETETQRHRGLRLELQCRIVQLKLVERLAQVGVIGGVDRENSGKDPRLDRLESRQWSFGPVLRVGQSIAHRRAVNLLDAGGDETDLATAETGGSSALWREDADLVGVMFLTGRHHADLFAFAQLALLDPDQRVDAEVVIEPGIDDQRLERAFAMFRRRNAIDDRLEYIGNPHAGLGADQDRIAGIDADDVLDLDLDPLRVGRRKIDLVDHRDHGQALLDCRVAVGHALRFDALGRIDHQQGTLAGGQRARYLVGKIDVAGGVDEIELVATTVAAGVVQGHALGLDRDATFALDIHRIEYLLCHFPIGQATADLDETVGQRRLAMIDMGNDGKVSNAGTIAHRIAHRESGCCGQARLAR